jgi:hypothetical protein
MRKALNVIKYNFIFTFIFLFNISIFSQIKIEGEYYSHDKFGAYASSYIFNNGLFSYEFSGHLGVVDYGEGTYLITRDSILTIDFNKTKNRNKSKYKIISTTENSMDSIQLKFIVKDKKKSLSQFK